RVFHVTGVQTCALPIFRYPKRNPILFIACDLYGVEIRFFECATKFKRSVYAVARIIRDRAKVRTHTNCLVFKIDKFVFYSLDMPRNFVRSFLRTCRLYTDKENYNSNNSEML